MLCVEEFSTLSTTILQGGEGEVSSALVFASLLPLVICDILYEVLYYIVCDKIYDKMHNITYDILCNMHIENVGEK